MVDTFSVDGFSLDSASLPDDTDLRYSVSAGDVVCCKNGRDKGLYMVVLAVENEYAFIANGKTRKSDRPKKKKLKHLRLNLGRSEHIANKIAAFEKVTNTELRITVGKYNHANTI